SVHGTTRRRSRGNVGKKLIALADLLIEHSETIEADLARFYPRDKDQLTEWYAGRMSLRRLWVLVSNLPPDAATNEALAGGREVAAWTLTVELLAQANDRLAIRSEERRVGREWST